MSFNSRKCSGIFKQALPQLQMSCRHLDLVNMSIFAGIIKLEDGAVACNDKLATSRKHRHS